MPTTIVFADFKLTFSNVKVAALRHLPNGHRKESATYSRKKGFALILSLSLMSVVVLSVVLLAVQIQVAVATQTNSQQKSLDNQYTLLGASIAMSQIQKELGRDAAVTARAGITGNNGTAGVDLPETSQMWTGVWNASRPSDPAVWLASGDGPEPNHPNGVEILSRGPNNIPVTEQRKPVEVPAINLPSLNGTQGSFAWWVSDEGVKAPIGINDAVVEALTANSNWMGHLPRAQVRNLRQLQPHRFGIESIFTNLEPDLPDSESWRQIQMILPSHDAYPITESYEYFHDLTANTYGVLSKPGDNGLQQDLSLSPDLLGPVFEAWQNYSDYMIDPTIDPLGFYRTQGSEDLRRRYRITPPASEPLDGEIVHSVAPVLTDFLISFGVFRRTTTNDFRLRVRVHAELWNPYTSALLPADLQLVIYGLPTIEIYRDGTTLINTFNLTDVLSTAEDPDDGVGIVLPFDSQPFANNDSRSWLPGRVYNWTTLRNTGTEAPPVPMEFYDRNAWGTFHEVAVPEQFYPSPGVTTPFSVRTNEPVTIALELRDEDGNVLKRIEGAEFSRVNTPTGGSTSVGPRFGFRIRIIESGDLGEDMSIIDPADVRFAKGEWLMNNDPRSFLLTVGDLDEGDAYFLPNGNDPTDYRDSNPGHKVSQPTHLFDRVAGGSGLRPMEDVPLFELPRQPLLNVGQLQNLRVNGGRPNSIGNSWGSNGVAHPNRKFDEYFFSGFVGDEVQWTSGQPLPNPRLIPAPESTATTVAHHRANPNSSATRFLINGSFNLNSDSVNAWRALLASSNWVSSLPTILQWKYVNKNDTGSNTGDMNIFDPFVVPSNPDEVKSIFTRFPQSAQETFYLGEQTPATASVQPPTEYFRRGVTSLTVNGIDHTRRLAEQIVLRSREAIEDNGRPFFSLSEFLAPQDIFDHPYSFETAKMSVLERAILDVDIIANGFNTFGSEEVWWLSPMFLSQGDLMSGISGILRSRSDTFRIRAKGSSSLPMNNLNSANSDILEIWVQRLPTTVIETDSIILPNENLFGRKFTVLSYRWIKGDS